MRPSQQAVFFNPQSVTNGATVSGNVDTKGYDWLVVDVVTSTSNDTTNNPATLKLSESDDTVATNFSDIGTFKGDDTSDGFTIPNAVTSGAWGVQMRVDLRGRKRYIKLSVSPVTTQVISGVASLGRGDEAPVSASGDAKAVVEG